jgi:DNA-binding GntR family transcriptional regulator
MKRRISSPIKRQETIKDQIVTLVTKAILDGSIQPGEKINESRIARELRVSRSPVREALHQLEEQGLIESIDHGGMVAVSLTEEDVAKINSLRVILEAEALRLARARLTAQSEEKLAKLVERIERSGPGSPYELARLDFEFHRTIWSFTGNEYLEKTLCMLAAPLFAHSGVAFARQSGDAKRDLESHRPLFDYVRGTSSEPSAEQAMVKHLEYWKEPTKYSSLAIGKSVPD